MAANPPLSHGDYTVGWICTLPLEMAAAQAFLDEVHEDLPVQPNDQNAYTLGRIGKHNVVIACLPSRESGIVSANTVAMQLLSSFHSIRLGLTVGLGGGVPNLSRDVDIRLGDIVVSEETDIHPAVVQYDYGKALTGGEFQMTSKLNKPPHIFRTALSKLQANHIIGAGRFTDFLLKIQKVSAFARPTEEDRLYVAEYEHVDMDSTPCDGCNPTKTRRRSSRGHDAPVVHYGPIASANQVVKDSRLRDRLSHELGVYCVEREAAGLMNTYPCLVIRGICGYADSHGDERWQGYAAAAAAAYAKELLLVIPINRIDQTRTVQDTLSGSRMICLSAHKVHSPLDLAAVPVIGNFLGRQVEIQHLWNYLQPASQSRKVAILHGLGGMGKTQLAARSARDHNNDFTAIFWLSGKDRSTLLQSLSTVLPRLPEYFRNSEKDNSDWLIIFDNIDQYSPKHSGVGDGYDISEFFPTADHGSILITSRLQRLTELGKSFPAQRLESKDAIQLLLRSSGLLEKSIVGELENNPDTLALADRLDGLPLAIAIAGAFIRETGTSTTQYFQYYKRSWHDLQSQSSAGRQYQHGNIVQTWMISYREIKKRDPEAAELLLLLARFDNRDIWYELVKGVSKSPNVPAWLKKAVSSGLAFRVKMRILIEFSLIETNQQGGSYAMHPVVQDWCLHIASSEHDVNLVQLNELALISVGFMVPNGEDRDSLKLQRRLIPHANCVHHRDWPGDNIAGWQVLHGLGILYSEQRKFKEAKRIYQQALTGYEKTLCSDHILILGLVHDVGLLYSNQGKLNEAEKMYQRALTGYEKTLESDHTFTLNTVNNLGLLYDKQGKLKESERMYQRTLTGYEKTLDSDHTLILNTVNNLGTLYYCQGRLKKAEKMFQQALTGFEKRQEPDNPYTLNAVNNLGFLYYHQDKLKKAEEMFRRALAGYETALGPTHPDTQRVAESLEALRLADEE